MATGPQRVRAPRKPTTAAVNPIPTGRLGGAASVWNRPVAKQGFQTTGGVKIGSGLLPKARVAPKTNLPGSVTQAAAALAPPPAADPRDGAYTQGVTGLAGKIAAQKAQLALEGARQGTDLQTTLGRMAKARAGDLQSTNSNANRQGLYFSTVLGQRRAGVEGDYQQREDDAKLAGQRADEDRAAQVNGIGEVVEDASSPLGYRATGAAGTELQALFEQAIQRRLNLDEG